MSEFHDSAPSAPAVFYRSYSRRKSDGSRENYTEAITRVVNNLADIGGFSAEQRELCLEMGLKQHTFPSGRAMWVAGTEWAAKPENFYGYYNCQSSFIDDPSVFGLLMELAMCGTGTGAVLEAEAVDKLPPVVNKLNVIGYAENPGTEGGREDTEIGYDEVGKCYNVTVGDSRQGWVDAYQGLIGLAMNEYASVGPGRTIDVFLDLMEVRGPGEVLKGFGGVANPIRLRKTLENAAALLGKAAGRKLTPLECCLLIDEAASAVVAGNIRRSAGMRQFSEHDTEAAEAKLHLYKQDDEGNWSVDPEREVLRMANHTRTWHHKPTYGEILTAVTSQFKSGEGAIQYVPEAIARANADLLDTSEKKKHFIRLYCETGKTAARGHLRLLAKKAGLPYNEKIIHHRMHRYGLNPCAEILLKDNLCVAGDTPIITSDGIHEIKSLVGKEVEVWNGESFAKVAPFKTGEADKLYRVEFGDGTFLDVTGAHRFWVKHRFMRSYVEKTTLELLEAVDSSRYKFHTEPFEIIHLDGIRDPMAYTMGVLVGDGTVHSGGYMHLDLFGTKADLPVRCSETLGPFRRDGYSVDHVTCRGFSGVDATAIKAMKSSHKALWEIAKLDRKSILEFIAGLADSDGSNTAGNGIRIYMSGRERAEAIYLLLQKCGIRSSINLMARAGERTNMGIRSEDVFYVQVTDCKEIPCYRLDVSKGRKATAKGKNQVINAVYPLDGQHETYCFTEPKHHKGVFKGTLTGQCNLSEIHLNTLAGKSLDEQRRAFYAGGLQVAALLQHHFPDERLQYSREHDPIVAVSFTGLFDFFVETLGVGWLDWMSRGRPFADNSTAYKAAECFYLTMWRDAAKQAVLDYCEEHGLKPPNRFTAVQPAGSKSLLTGASSGWHPPKAQRFIRRITFGKSDPLVAALRDYGYKVVPAQSARDDDGNLLDDVNDPRVHEVLVEIPTEVPWANLPGADQYDLGRLPVEAQFGLYMQVQRQYSTHTTSATIEFREAEIEVLSRLIYDEIQADGGYISAALLARFDANATFPRLPFEPIDKQTYDRMMAQIKAFRVTLPEDVTVLDLLKPYDTPNHVLAPQDTACANGACLAKVEEDEAKGIK